MVYYRDANYLIWIDNDIIWRKLHNSEYTIGYDIFTMVIKITKTFDRYEPKSIIYEEQEALDKYNNKLFYTKRKLKIDKILNDIL